MNTRRVTSETGPSQCSKCSAHLNETVNSIVCDTCECWIHVQCNNIPAEAMNDLELDGVFWFCEPCSKTMKKLTKLEKISDAEFRAEVEVDLTEVKTPLHKLSPLP